MNPVDTLSPREAVRHIDPYVPPTEGRSAELRLDFNENTVGCSPLILESLRAALDACSLSKYPAYGEARQELARFFCVPPGELLLTNGTDEAIQVVVNTFVDSRDEVVLLRPSYAMYRFYSQAAGAAVREVAYRLPGLEFPLEELLRTIGPSTRAVLIANPNNPTGTGLELNGIEELLKVAAHAAVLVDEAYFDFCGVTALPLLSSYKNLFVSRTFSKAYGLAALRVGCVFSRAENIAWLQRCQSPYSVNALAAVAACAATRDRTHLREYVAEVLRGREVLCRGLDALGISYVPSRANFVLLDFEPRARELHDRLREHGVLVRDRSYELPGCLRVTVGTEAQMKCFLARLKSVW